MTLIANDEYSGKLVLLTGAGSGFGRIAAARFAEHGARLALCDINLPALESLAHELDLCAEDLLIQKCDVSDATDVQSFIDTTIDRFGRIDIAVNNAGIGHDQLLLADCDEALWNKIIAVNLSGVFHFMTREIQQMLKQGGGIILNVASVAGVLGAPKLGPYCASKHGVVGLTKTAAAEYGEYGIRTISLCPGFSPTPLVEALLDGEDEVSEQQIYRANSAGTHGETAGNRRLDVVAVFRAQRLHEWCLRRAGRRTDVLLSE